MPLDLPLQTGAEKGIDDQIKGIGLKPLQIVRTKEKIHSNMQIADDAKMYGRITLDPIRADQQKHPDLGAKLLEMTRHDKTVSAVIAGSGEYRNLFSLHLPEVATEAVNGLLSGIFHQHRTGNADIINGCSVNPAHLFSPGKLHAYSSEKTFIFYLFIAPTLEHHKKDAWSNILSIHPFLF